MNRTEIEALTVGDLLQSTFDVEAFTGCTKLKPNARYGTARKIVKISVKKEDIHGKLFIQGETEHGPTSTITFSIKEGEILYRKVD